MDINKFEGEYFFLSNDYEVPVDYNLSYKNAEVAFQAQKCLAFSDKFKFTENKKINEKILQNIKIRPDWEKLKLAFMKDVVYAKFMQNPKLAERLIATGSSNLINGNDDKYWGVDIDSGAGENQLGKILMEVRTNINNMDVVLLNRQDTLILTRFTIPENVIYKPTSVVCRYPVIDKNFKIDLYFEKKYDITYKKIDDSIQDCKYKVHDKNFVDLDFLRAEVIEELYSAGDYKRQIRRCEDGMQFLFQCDTIPTFDDGDNEWDSVNVSAMYRDKFGINLIQARRGYRIPKINIFIGLQEECLNKDFQNLIKQL